MKAVFAALAMTVLAACGQVESQSSVESQVATINFAFQVDKRPVDGNLTQLFIIQNQDRAKYTITIKSTSLRGGVKSNVLSSKFNCKIVSSMAGANKIDCIVDDRPVDGIFTAISVVKTGEDRYDATQTTKFYDRIHGKEVVKNQVIGTRMSSFYVQQTH